jgi:hypothetical protein
VSEYDEDAFTAFEAAAHQVDDWLEVPVSVKLASGRPD